MWGLGAVWEIGPSPCSGERKEVVGRGGAEVSVPAGGEQLLGLLGWLHPS